jgi:hypothetical protein
VNLALATCLNRGQDDLDLEPLLAACAARGHAAREVAWDDAAADWTGFDAVLLRSTWNYFHDRAGFLAWAAAIAARIPIWNPLEIVQWNTHKFYLRDLASRGIAILPTLFLPAGSRLDLAAFLDSQGWEAAVLKPAVSADAFATMRAPRSDPAAGQTHLALHLPDRDMLVQRYSAQVVEPGERCLIFLEGEFSHAVRKRSLFMGGRHAGPEGMRVEADRDEITTAVQILSCTGFPAPLYARIDLLRDESGVPCLLELEMVEPSLFLDCDAVAATRLVRGLESRLERF